MTFDEYVSILSKNKTLSPVKVLILKTLWGEDDSSFPKKWVCSKKLLELTNQKYFDRRARELRDQNGADIESQHIVECKGHAWRLRSSNVNKSVNREYLTEQQKNTLFANAQFTCVTCGNKDKPGIRGLQADHKVPLSRDGSNDFSNWQAVCNECNVSKRRACQDCKDDCSSCIWAYPEKVGIKNYVYLNKDEDNKITNYAKKDKITKPLVLKDAVVDYISKRQKKG